MTAPRTARGASSRRRTPEGEAERWQDHAECQDANPDLFMTEKGTNGAEAHHAAVAEAKTFCAACPVATECLDHALALDERHGVWGGLDERERRQLQRRRVSA